MGIINMKEAEEEFIKYADNYDLTVEMLKLKKYHSLRVMEISNKIAQKENFTEEETELATLIGLLHDIARFKQYTEYKTYRDVKSFDHGDMAIKILEKDNFIRKFIKTDKYDKIIKLAIKNHNKLAVEDGLTEEENKFCKLIRDADKIDIFFIATGILWKNQKEEMENSILNPEIKQALDEQKMIENNKYEKIEYVDSMCRMLGYLFDVNFKSSFDIIKEEEYIDKMVKRFKFKDEYTQKEIIKSGEKMKEYISNKIQK